MAAPGAARGQVGLRRANSTAKVTKGEASTLHPGIWSAFRWVHARYDARLTRGWWTRRSMPLWRDPGEDLEIVAPEHHRRPTHTDALTCKFGVSPKSAILQGLIRDEEVVGYPYERDSRLVEVTQAAIRSATCSGDSCSQKRRTVHPSAVRWSVVSTSRAMFLSSLARHHSAFVFGRVACSGQPCQKQPSMKTAILAFVKTMSIARRGMLGTGTFTR